MLTKGFAFSFRALRMGFILVAAMLLVSCGGGGGGTSTPPAADPTGYYGTSGTLDYTAVGGTTVNATKVQGIVENNQILLFTSNGFDIYDIQLTSISGNDFTGTAKVYENTGTKLEVADLTISGTITAGSSITGTFSSATASFGQGTFTLVYNDQMGAIPSGSNNWGLTVSLTTVDFNTDGAGAIANGPTTPTGLLAGCSVSPGGTTTQIGSSKIYKVVLSLANSGATCAFAGDYTGYLVAQDAAATALAMAIVKTDGTKALGASFAHEP